MWVYCHREHQYEDRARRVLYELHPGLTYDLPEETARLLATAHASRVCLLADAQSREQAAAHKCKLTREAKKELAAAMQSRRDALDTMEASPEEDTMMRVRWSPQRRRTLRQTLQRSGRARAERARSLRNA